MSHTFHIPVLGLAYSIDTPLKVARYGISSVVSIVDDELTERMRDYHCKQNDLEYIPIQKSEHDSRARRITAYLNLLNRLVNDQFSKLREELYEAGSDIERYFNLLPDDSVLKQGYDLLDEYEEGSVKNLFEQVLKNRITKGAIDVNIMAKVDKLNYDKHGKYSGDENTDALAALRGFAESDLESSVVISAGMNPKLFSYLEAFDDFYPDANGKFRKKVILKVSNYRSAIVQAKVLAKKGIWVSEFRIESGLNCGGHAFATDGLLLGPILEEFKVFRSAMRSELYEIYRGALTAKGRDVLEIPQQKISAQGGIGTADEDNFLRKYYQLDSTGWGSPFLLVPEATNVDKDTLQQLADAGREDFYLSNVSPLGVLFNNFRGSGIEKQRLHRIAQNRPGSPCTKKYLCSNTEFTERPICTASREYQRLKITQLDTCELTDAEYQKEFDKITEKVCLCEGLAASVYIKNDMLRPREKIGVSICPGPNLAYFSRTYSLDEMIGHIYGKNDLLKKSDRSNVFINELNLYIDYLAKEIANNKLALSEKKAKYLESFKQQLRQGIDYYRQLIPKMKRFSIDYRDKILHELSISELRLSILV
ncbi:hypothetical protein [Mucilaginibacter sp. BT774]|uniref:hypothetical protein n=1 Tax=Mucilaginibacter sp. BT774 TaxID=3062276 RepID=UPI002675CB04|nr:hypothetical protein [Mucilaginibacter sp. BT774]MDO3627292.1 hypothetical protein [Mucilaginibacter sp. BT774]